MVGEAHCAQLAALCCSVAGPRKVQGLVNNAHLERLWQFGTADVARVHGDEDAGALLHGSTQAAAAGRRC